MSDPTKLEGVIDTLKLELADLQHPTKRRNNTPIGPRSSNNGWSKPA